MKEIKGELWSYHGKPKTVVCITTNGTIKKDGSLVMGRGCALEAKMMYPGIPLILGKLIKAGGNIPHLLKEGFLGSILSFPTKNNWWEKSDLGLIAKSAAYLKYSAIMWSDWTYVLPRPGCGNGGLRWEEVKPLLMGLPDNVLVISKE